MSRLDPAASLLRAYSASARINQYLVERLHPAVWRAPAPAGPGRGRVRTIAALVAHLHNCGLRYLERTDPAARVPADLDRGPGHPGPGGAGPGRETPGGPGRRGGGAGGRRRIVGFSPDAASYLGYDLGHDHHHRGQIVMPARLLGHPVSRDTMTGMWQWTVRARK
jgi:uncharacterized damage-inducible protein DinB